MPLSFASNTVIKICTVPDMRGSPPSVAVRVKEICCCISLSSAFCKTISTFLLPSFCSFSFRLKLSLDVFSIVLRVNSRLSRLYSF
uniref:Uncharacterized protein n=1 Tax=Oryzias latipes TaxID=8090 RepID=A0A3P9JQB5_ORYLA